MTYRPRIIPVLLLHDGGLVKSVQFKDYTYIGDPMNAVKIFNEMNADELIFLDITASKQGRTMSKELVRVIGEEAKMPFCVGGGIRSLDDIQHLVQAGAEKVVLGHSAASNPSFVREASRAFGSSTVSVCIDIKKDFWGREKIWSENGKLSHNYTPKEFALRMEEAGAGELVIQSIQRDGTLQGYDINSIQDIAQAVAIPVVALGGAGSLDHLHELYQKVNVNGLAAGSIFVFHGIHKGVLIQYPTINQKEVIYADSE